VVVLLGVSLITLSARSGGSGVFNRVRAYARDVANPFQSGVHSALEPVGNFLYGALHYGSLERENQVLRREVVAAEGAEIQATAEEAEAAQVLAQEHLDYISAIPSIAAQVIDLGSANFEQTMEINRGSGSGVALGEPVVSSGGLVGSVTAVSGHLATVTLLDDPSFAVGVRVVGSGVVGAATGQGQGNPLSVQDIDVGARVKRGDELVTSGLQLEQFPAGIPVGTVTSVFSPPGGLQQDISMKPLASLDNLQLVRVLLWSAQSR
jgi:rod shape-determining protein MreC